MPDVTYHIQHPTSENTVGAGFDDLGTPQQLIDQLLQNGWLKPAEKGDYVLVVRKGDRQLFNEQTFAEQNVGDGAELLVRHRANGAARRRGPTEARMAMDHRSLQSVSGRGCVLNVTCYADSELNEVIDSESDAYRMRYYRVDYRIPIPSSREAFGEEWSVVFDLNQDWPNYPSANHRPAVRFVGPKPWHYRVNQSGWLCTNPVGSAAFVAGQHVGTVAGLLNGDEPYELTDDRGYDPCCYTYYRSKFNGPITPGLSIPSVEPWVFDDPTIEAVGPAPSVALVVPPAAPVLRLARPANAAGGYQLRLPLN